MKYISVFLVVSLSISGFSQDKPLSEKEWKARCVQAKKQTEALLSKFSQHDALVLKNYSNIFDLSWFQTRYEEYKRGKSRYEKGLYKLWVLQEDTSGYQFRYLHTNDAERAAKLSDSLKRLKTMREFWSLSRFQMQFDYIANYQTQDYNYIVTEYGILDKEMNKQLHYAKSLILTDTLAQSALLQRNMDQVVWCHSLNEQTNSNIHFCLESLKARYLENPEGTFPEAYERYFSVYRQVTDQPKTNGTHPVLDYALEKVDQPASFPGGQAAFQEYVDRKLKESNVVLEGCGEWKVEVKFDITSLGYVSNVRFSENNPKCPKYVAEAMRIVKESPDWFPAKNKGKIVSSVHTVELLIK
ncbi:hypothetical protein D3C87_277440 [compost metagenome]